MTLLTMDKLLIPARQNKYAVGAFEFWSFDSAQAVIEAAEELNAPVILQAGPFECDFAGGADKLAKIAYICGNNAGVPVALHLDHGDSFDLVLRSVDAGFTSIMIDASHLSFEENVEITLKVVELARSAGVSVESELGRIPGAEGIHEVLDGESMQTDPEDAAEFVKLTGIDALAISVGTGHGYYKFPPKINIQRLKSIADKVSIPLVLHGGSATPDDKVLEAIQYGIAKVNICTEFLSAYGNSFIKTQSSPGFRFSVPALFGAAKLAGKELVKTKISLFKNQK